MKELHFLKFWKLRSLDFRTLVLNYFLQSSPNSLQYSVISFRTGRVRQATKAYRKSFIKTPFSERRISFWIAIDLRVEIQRLFIGCEKRWLIQRIHSKFDPVITHRQWLWLISFLYFYWFLLTSVMSHHKCNPLLTQKLIIKIIHKDRVSVILYFKSVSKIQICRGQKEWKNLKSLNLYVERCTRGYTCNHVFF